MPILARYPVVNLPPATVVVPPPTETRWLALESLDGESLLPASSGSFFFQDGIDGLEIPPREIIRKKHPGMAGSRIKEIRTGEREVFLPTFIERDNQAEFLQFLDQLEELFDYRNVDYRSNDGTLNLVAYSQRGDELIERRLRCAYTAGMDTGYGTDNHGTTWASYGLKFLGVQPYWYGPRWTSPVIRQAEDPGWFDDWPGELAASQTLGEFTVSVEGRAESWITVDVEGPSTLVTVDGQGNHLTIPGMSDGEAGHIVTDPRGRTALFDGDKDWSRVSPGTSWKPLAPGDRKMTITMAGLGSNSQAVVSGPTLFERPW